MEKNLDDNDKCLCHICKKDITNDKPRVFKAECSYDLCEKHYRMVVDLANRIVDGLEYCFEEEQRIAKRGDI